MQACDRAVESFRGPRKGGQREWEPRLACLALPNNPPSCPSVLDAEGLVRTLFNQLWEVCSRWQKQVPSTAQAPQRPWLVSIHAIRNTRRKMEDRHVCLSAFNQLFGLSVSAPPPVPSSWAPGWHVRLVSLIRTV